MFNVCYECDGKLEKKTGDVYGYWGDTKVKFVGMPKHQCIGCDEFYLDENVAILTQEITRAMVDLDEVPAVVDVSNCYSILIDHLDDIYDAIVGGKLYFTKINDKIIFNDKDVRSLFSDCNILLAARNIDKMTSEVLKEIERFDKESKK